MRSGLGSVASAAPGLAATGVKRAFAGCNPQPTSSLDQIINCPPSLLSQLFAEHTGDLKKPPSLPAPGRALGEDTGFCILPAWL